MHRPFPSAADDVKISHEITVYVAVADHPPTGLPARLRYHRKDPYAVCLSLGGTATGTVDWVFARALLSEGLGNPVGVGDVLVRPQRRGHRHWVRVIVRSTAGYALLDIATTAVRAFLDQTELLVPTGAEGRHIDLDRLIAELVTGNA
ncbi:SsgA family sporulation/cell division regulator [Streptomyces sp. NPDC057702]|uniref:SsgA family sporulation/cell division regulator n=1 Tax=unclassified Streptomyces TaxID=2593676 RepID=UPI0036A828E1